MGTNTLKNKALQQATKRVELYTPPYAVRPLIPFISEDIRIIWEPTDFGSSYITQVLKKAGYEVISTHKNAGIDFLQDEPDFQFDMIITNPPYTMKEQFLERCYNLGKPFALLMPLTALEGKKRQKLYAKYGIQLIIPDKRIKFLKYVSDINKFVYLKNVWFATAWFTWGLDLERDLNFVHIEEEILDEWIVRKIKNK